MPKMRFKKKALLSITFLVLSVFIIASTIFYMYRYKGKETTVTRDTFTVISHGGTGFGKKIIERSVRYEDRYCRIFDLEKTFDFDKLTIRVFYEKEKMWEFIKSKRRNAPDFMDGTYLRNPSVVCLASGWHMMGHVDSFLAHEITHYFNHKYFMIVDPWIEEGTALFFSTYDSDMKPNGEHDLYSKAIQGLILKKLLVDIRKLIALEDWEFYDPKRLALHCMASWGLINYLIE
ncbi:MAG: hypothetical protein ACYTHN_14315, partial [Planctomycetota bacterium]